MGEKRIKGKTSCRHVCHVRVLQKGYRDVEDYGSQTDLHVNRPETEK